MANDLRIFTKDFVAFTEDNLLHSNSIQHHGVLLTEDEELTPTLQNVIILTWLRLVHPDLPKLVKQCYGTELALAHLPPSSLRSCKLTNLCCMKSMPVKMLT